MRLFRPLARMMLRQNVAVGEAVQGLKEAYVEAAEHQLSLAGEKPTNARLAVLTGLDRNEVSRIRRGVDRSGKPIGDETPVLHLNRAARVVTNWPKEKGQALELPYSGEHSFVELVKQHSGGIPAPSLLEELKRNQTAVQLENGDVKLLNEVFIPRSNSAKLEISSEQLSRLLSSVEHNINHESEQEPFLQLELVFKDLSDDISKSFSTLSKQEMNRLLQSLALKIQAEREQYETDNPHEINTEFERKSGLGVYFFDIKEKN